MTLPITTEMVEDLRDLADMLERFPDVGEMEEDGTITPQGHATLNACSTALRGAALMYEAILKEAGA